LPDEGLVVMRRLVLSIIALGVAVACGPAAAEQKAPSPRPYHRDSLASVLSLRLRSIDLQIDILSDRGMIGRDEVRDLREESQRLARRLYGLSGREARDLELAVDRLQANLRSAADVALIDGDAFNRRDLGRFDDGDRYARDFESYDDRDSYYRSDPRGDPFAIWEERDRREGR
jgi:hypothetical protein